MTIFAQTTSISLQSSPFLTARKIVSRALDCWNEILLLPLRYIRIQFELVEVARLFLLRPGNKA